MNADSIKLELKSHSPVTRGVTATVAAKLVNKELDRAFRSLGRKVRLPGFRPGKAPRKVLEKRFGEAVFSEVAETFAQRAFAAAVERFSLLPVHLDGMETPEVRYGEDLCFQFTVEIKPEVEIDPAAALRAERPKVEVTDEEVESELDNVARRGTTIESLDSEGPISDEHLVDLDLIMNAEDMEEPLENKGYLLSMTDDPFHGFVVEALRGRKVGESFEAELQVGERYWRPEWADKTVQAQITINGLKRMVVPEIDEEFAKDQGFEGLQELKNDLRSHIVEAKEHHAQALARDSLVNHLIATNDFEVGPGLIERQAQAVLEETFRRVAGHGVEMPQLSLQDLDEEQASKVVESAQRRVRRSLLLEAYAKALEVEAPPEAIQQRVQDIARDVGESVGRVHATLEKTGGMEELRIALRDDATLDRLLEQAEVSEVPWPGSDADTGAADAATESDPATGSEPATEDDRASESDRATEDEQENE
jgi:trigger factor